MVLLASLSIRSWILAHQMMLLTLKVSGLEAIPVDALLGDSR